MPPSPHALAAFHPLIRRWFAERFAAPTDAQARAWPLIAAGEHVLVSAPTGSGKTLTAFLAAIDHLVTGRWPAGAVRVLYLSPLKALNSDVRRNLVEPLAELRALFAREGQPFPPIRVLTRSGDTPDHERRAMLRHPPEILITTPESLNLLLTGGQSRHLFGGLRAVILDEIHALAASKRGTYMMSAVERLSVSAGEIQRIALSATVRPVAAVAAFMAGYAVSVPGPDATFHPRPVRIVESADPRGTALTLRTPDVEIARGPEASELRWQALAGEVRAIVARNRSTLIFANSRRTVEKVARLLNADAETPVAYAHHGSLSREIRLDVEERLKTGRLRAVVATGSLELGIDIGAVDEVVLVGTPPSVAQAIQRIGRADHRVGGIGRASLFPLHGLDSAQAAALSVMLGQGAIEELRPIQNPLDVLAQVLLSMGCGAIWDLDQLFAHVRGIAAYHELPRPHFDLVVAMLAGRYADAPVRELKPRALVDRVQNTFTTRAGTEFVLYQSGGTIPDRGYYHLRLAESKAVIGELDEEFVWERRLGDQFTFGTQSWRILSVTHNDVEVAPADARGPMIPFWKAEEQNRSTAASFALLDFFDACEASLGRADVVTLLAARHGMDPACARSLVRFLQRQRDIAGAPLPGRRRILVEHTPDAAGAAERRQAILHTFWGGRVNRPLAIALAEAWERAHGSPLEAFATNDQILVMLPDGCDPAALLDLVPATALPDLLRAGLEKTALFGARFRENCSRALLLPRGDARKRYPLWLNRLRGKKLLAAVRRFPDFPIVLETWRELLEDEFDLPTLTGLLDEVAARRIDVQVIRPAHTTPFADGVVFRQTNYHMYLDDAPGASGGTQLADGLLGPLLSERGVAPAVPEALAALLAEKLLRSHPDYRPGTREEILVAVRETPLLPSAVVRDWLLHLPPEEQPAREDDPLAALVAYTLPGASVELVADLADLPRLLFLRGGRAATVPRALLGGTAEPLLAYLRTHPHRSQTEAAAALPGEFLKSRAVVALPALTAALGFSEAELVPLLDELLVAGSIVAGQLLEGRSARCYCDAENAERLLRMRRAAQREQTGRELAPRPLAELPAFLAEWQGLHRPVGSLEALQGALDRLFGFPAPAELWEQALLPSRLSPYHPSWLDTLFQSYGLGWIGCGHGKVTLALASDQELFASGAERAAVAGSPQSLVAQRLEEASHGLGFFDLVAATALDTAALADALWDLAWAGHAASDSFETVRRGVQSDFAAEPVGEGRGRGGFRRWERSRPSAGTWRRLPPHTPAGPLERAELDKERARLVLARYGVVFRALLERELPGLRWARLFRALRALELGGEIVAGHFFAGVPSLQFATPAAIRRLAEPPAAEAIYFVNACDPASPCGLALDGLSGAWPRRLPGNWLVLRGTRLVLALQKSGGDLAVHVPPGDACLASGLAIYPFLLGRELAPPSAITVETINGQSAIASPYAEDLRRAGFTNDYRGLSLWRR